MDEWIRGLVDEMHINNNSRHLPAVVVFYEAKTA